MTFHLKEAKKTVHHGRLRCTCRRLMNAKKEMSWFKVFLTSIWLHRMQKKRVSISQAVMFHAPCTHHIRIILANIYNFNKFTKIMFVQDNTIKLHNKLLSMPYVLFRSAVRLLLIILCFRFEHSLSLFCTKMLLSLTISQIAEYTS